MSHITMPPYIALCGNPGAGKSEVQRILTKLYRYDPVDDGYPLRKFAMDFLGLTWEQVSTQEGKKEMVTIDGREWQVREILGELGNRLEDMFGPNAMPFMACNRCDPDGGGLYSFGSVRKTQGAYYKARGGIVVEIQRPFCKPSPYPFDEYDKSLVDVVIQNDGTIDDLEQSVIALMQCYTEVNI